MFHPKTTFATPMKDATRTRKFSDRSSARSAVAYNFRNLAVTIIVTMLMGTSNAFALGLGNLEIQSNLDQPLNGFIDLRVTGGDELQSIVANMATEEEFANLGIDYPSYMSDISLSLETQGDRSILRVSSGDVIIREPFIHFLVRIDWSGGSFLREYTALIDPPTYAAETPRALSTPRVVGVDQSFEPSYEPEIEAEELVDPYEDDYVDSEEDYTEPDVYQEEEPYVEEEITSADSVEDDYQDETVTESDVVEDDYYGLEEEDSQLVEEDDSEEPYVDESSFTDSESSIPTDARYGPVAYGETLSQIAADLQAQFPDLSIYQVMKVLFDENEEAFINGNINGLMAGTVLNIGDLDAIRAVDIAASKDFYREHLNDWDSGQLISSSSESDESLSIGSDTYSFDDDIYSDDELTSTDSDSLDAFQVGASSDVESVVSSDSGNSSEGEVLLLRQQIADLQTSVTSGDLENLELTERISMLEGQLADMNRLMELSVENAELASVEAALAEQNEQDEYVSNDDLVDLANEFNTDALEDSTPLDGEDYDSLVELDDETLDSELLAFDDSGDPIGGGDDDLGVDSTSIGDDEFVSDLSEVESAETDNTVAVAEPAESASSVALQSQASFYDNVKEAVVESGGWRFIAAIGAVLALVGGLLVYRRRKADEEFEISMLSIGSQSQTMDDLATKSVSQIDQKSDVGGGDRDTSFLTVYTDAEAVVQTQEVDPMAEADVYIAYGRDEQAEEVLIDGIASYPARADIKHKLLTLYHKNTNIEGFERLAEEVYAQRSDLSDEAWDDIARMGLSISPENPIFEMPGAGAELLLSDTDAVEESGSSEPGSSEPSLDDVVDEGATPDEEELNLDDDDDETKPVESSSIDEIVHTDAPADQKVDDTIADGVVDYQADVAVGEDGEEDHPLADDPSINLINFDDGRSEISELDEVEIDTLSRAEEESDFDDGGSTMEIDLASKIDFDTAFADTEISLTEMPEVSGLEIEGEYEEARTQYELAKVFIDLGDEDGARKILSEILENADNGDDVLADTKELLDSMGS